MKIVYIGDTNITMTSYHRAQALRRNGHEVLHINPEDMIPNNVLTKKWAFHTGGFIINKVVKKKICNFLSATSGNYNAAIVNNPTLISPQLVDYLSHFCGRVACYINDDPFSGRQRQWRLLLKSIPFYDLITVVREPNIHEAYNYGAKEVLRVHMSADEVAHAPREINEEEQSEWKNEVVFVGSGWEDRTLFAAKLIELGVPLTVYGNHWEGQEGWEIVKNHHRRPALGEEYVKAIQCAKLCLGLLSDRNRDQHTQRSVEIPYIGSVLCAKRTSEHKKMYEEGKEAVFWDDAEECAEVCFDLLRNEEKRKQIAQNGREKCIENGHLNEKIMSKTIRYLTS